MRFISDSMGEVVLCVCKFITCEGQFSLVFSYHFKILNHLRHHKYINMSYFMWKYLELMSRMVKGSKNLDKSLAYHGLIIFLVKYPLQKKNYTWESFVGISSSTRHAGRKKRKTLEDTLETPRKKLDYTGNRRRLQAETPTSSIEGPHTLTRSRD